MHAAGLTEDTCVLEVGGGDSRIGADVDRSRCGRRLVAGHGQSLAASRLPSASSASAWGTAAGALFAWEPFDLGLRGASIRGAEAAVGKHAPTRR